MGLNEQKQKFLLPFTRGEKIGCYALTEPQAGSNAAALQTKAVKKGDRYVINGTKAWITNGGVADAAIVYVNTEPSKGEKGITAIVVEKGTPGFKVGKEEKKLGINATACSELIFHGLRGSRKRIASGMKAKGIRWRFRRWMEEESGLRRRPRALRRAHLRRR